MSKQTQGHQAIFWDWKVNFTETLLKQGRDDDRNGKVLDFAVNRENTFARCRTAGGFTCAVSAPGSYRECSDYGFWETGGVSGYQYGYGYSRRRRLQDFGIGRADQRFQCNCSVGLNNRVCRHVASLMVHWEKLHGPFVFEETEEEERIRLEEEERERERIRLQMEREKLEKEEFQVIAYIGDRVPHVPGDVHFRPEMIVRDIITNRYETKIAESLKKKESPPTVDMNVSYGREGSQVLSISGSSDGKDVSFTTGRKDLKEIRCDCGRSRSKSTAYSWNKYPAKMCAHALLVFEAAWQKIVTEKPGDATDQKADTLLNLLAGNAIIEELPQEEKEKRHEVILTPRITTDNRSGSLQLSFTVGREGERAYVLKSLEKLVAAVDSEETFMLSKKAQLDFSQLDFTEESARWYDFIASRVRNINMINQRLDRGYYYSGHLSIGSSIPLEGSDLDLIYDMTEDTRLMSMAGVSQEETYVRVQPGVVKADITLTAKKSTDGKPLYIEMKGFIPRLLQGNQYRYILDSEQFGRVGDEELKVLGPYRKIADPEGNFVCRIGVRKFPEFYYRVFPALRESDNVILHDLTDGIISPDLLPPEPEFMFFIDLTEERITCRTVVSYADRRFDAGFDPIGADSMRDPDQEKRVLQAVRRFFGGREPSDKCFWTPAVDENLITVLTEGVYILSQFGEVKGSDAFGRVHVCPAPQPRFSVEIEGGLLELSVQTKDLSREELLELLDSYHVRKRWHRLRSGDFIDLKKAPGLEQLDGFSDAIGIPLEKMINGNVTLPQYRALYVDRLLEEHDGIATARDRHFKALVRSFRTIQDSDFEVSEGLTDIIRPYQLYGFRWLSTLGSAGFGGILADEMGLGKTLQMLAYLQSKKETEKETGEIQPSLVVCPASLVYNWKEECSRFTPDLQVELLAGGGAARKAQLKKLENGDGADLYVTSYDLLKRDIAHFENIRFSAIILDEAQYIKNQKAAVTKAVKVLKGEHRFALTGTPIENRLSEMWSIFDFLMPGFLYSAQEFARRFESPIMKGKDPTATQRLARMTAPFILRRKKTDVLKDLPEKLEEVQSCAMEKDQRRLYDAQVVRMREMLENFAGTGEDKLRILAEITRLRQICCDPSLLFEDYHGSSAKRTACLELIERAMDSGHRMLVFSQFTSMLDLLAKDLRASGIPFYTITGATPKQERVRLVTDFNGGDVPVFLISLKAGGTGLNLTGADVVIHYDPWWNLAVQNQATDRAHRIGQTRQVTVMRMIALNSIEEKIVRLQEAKREMADAIISGEGTSLASMTREELLELLG